MIRPGDYNTLRVVKILDFGIYLDGGEMGEILMPMKWVPKDCQLDDMLDVFIYFDSEDRPIATTLTPKAKVGEFAWLKVKQVNPYGAFLDLGLDKDLLVPFGEQNAKMQEGRSYLVYLYVDPQSKRIAASARLQRFLDKQPAHYQPGQEVDLIIWTRTDLGYKAIINQLHTGMMYHNQQISQLAPGMRIKGYINNIRPDGKIDLLPEPSGYQKIPELSLRILNILQTSGGFIPITDNSPPQAIYNNFRMSKKNFKKAIGALYKQRKIILEENGIRLPDTA